MSSNGEKEGGDRGRGGGAMTARTIIEMDRQRRRRTKGNKERGWQKYGRRSRKGGGETEKNRSNFYLSLSFYRLLGVNFFT